jgi:hypothetical protein
MLPRIISRDSHSDAFSHSLGQKGQSWLSHLTILAPQHSESGHFPGHLFDDLVRTGEERGRHFEADPDPDHRGSVTPAVTMAKPNVMMAKPMTDATMVRSSLVMGSMGGMGRMGGGFRLR